MGFKLGEEIGTSKPIELTMERRFQNTVVYGSSGSGKTRAMLLTMALEQMEDTSSGATFICTRGDTSWLLDRLAHKMNREVIFLHPDSDKGTHDFLETEYRTGFEMQKNLIDYAQAMREKKIVIIDFDLAKNKKTGRRSLIKLLYHLQRSVVSNTEEHPHFVYIDDAEFALPYIHDLVSYGKDNAVGTTLLMSSYSLIEAQSRILAYFLNAHTNTTIVMNRLTYEDFAYFNRRFYGNMDNKQFRQRTKDEVIVETIRDGKLDVLSVKLKSPTERFISGIEEEVQIEKNKREKRKRARSKGVVHEIEQTHSDVETDFDEPPRTTKIFLDEDEFLANL